MANNNRLKDCKVTGVPRPCGIDPLAVLNEREQIVANRIALRMHLLSNLPPNLPEETKLQAKIELRALKALNLQRQLRSEVNFSISFIVYPKCRTSTYVI